MSTEQCTMLLTAREGREGAQEGANVRRSHAAAAAAAAAAVTSGRYTDNKASTLVPKHACSHGHTMIVVLNAGREGAANHGYRACGMLQGACCRVSCAHLRRYVGCALPHVLPPRSTWPSFHRACLTCRCELQGSGPPAG